METTVSGRGNGDNKIMDSWDKKEVESIKVVDWYGNIDIKGTPRYLFGLGK